MDKFYNFLATWLAKKQGVVYTKRVLHGIIGCDFYTDQGDIDLEIRGFKMHPKYWALQIDGDFEKLGLMGSLQGKYGLKVDNSRYPEDFKEEVYHI